MKKALARHFGLVLRIYRTKKDLTQSQLAELCDLDWTYISMLETAARSPSLVTIFKLSKALGIAPSSMIKEVEKRVMK